MGRKMVAAMAGMLMVWNVLVTSGGWHVASAASLFAGGSGTAVDPYQIATAEQLDAVRENLSANYKLVADIDLSAYVAPGGGGYNEGKGWDPIGKVTPGTGMMNSTIDYFDGMFDGDGHTVSGLSINRLGERATGLFRGLAPSALVLNVGLDDVAISGGELTGGVAGEVKGIVANSYVTGTITGMNFTGGVAGYVHGTRAVVSYSYAIASVSGVGSNYIGGLAGGLYGGGAVRHAFAAGAVSGQNYVGGLVGSPYEVNVSASYYDMNASGQSDTGRGIGKSTADMKQPGTYAGWDFINTWVIEAGQTYPRLGIFASFPAPELQSATAGDTLVDLTWTTVDNALGYMVYQRAEGESYGDAIVTTAPSVDAFQATELTNGTRYYYVVTALGPDGESKTSNERSAVPQVPAPSAPTLQSAVAGNASAELSWTASQGATGYKVFQRLENGTYGNEVATVAASVYSYQATGLTNGQRYSFVVKASNPGGDSPASNELEALPQVPAPQAPELQLEEEGDGVVKLSWTARTYADSYDIFYRTASGEYGDETATVGASVYTVAGLANGETYSFIVQAKGAGGVSDVSNEVTAVPYTTPGAPTAVTADAGNQSVSVRFVAPDNDGGRPITGYIVTAVSDDETVTQTGESSPITVRDLKNGVAYTITVQAVNEAGEGEAAEAPRAVRPYAPVMIPIEPKKDDKGNNLLTGPVKVGQEDGRTVTTVVVDEKRLLESLADAGQAALFVLSVTATTDAAAGELTGAMVKGMEEKSAVLELRAQGATYRLPAGQIDIDGISRDFGTAVELKDIIVRVEVGAPTEEERLAVEGAALSPGTVLVGAPVRFSVKAYYNGQSIEVVRFAGYVERGIALPEGVDPSRMTTGVTIDPDGTVRHVPTKVVLLDGVYYAQINSLTNSVYSLVWNESSFSDISGHWSKATVEEMASRLIMDGMGDGRFEPNRAMTRAEFAAVVVRALGLPAGSRAMAYSDVRAEDWYAGAVASAQAYGLIGGFEDGTFRPNGTLTREQAMTIVARAMAVTGLAPERLAAAEALASFGDTDRVADWALDAAANSVAAGIMRGRADGTLAPQGTVTRAEAAVMMERLLTRSGLI